MIGADRFRILRSTIGAWVIPAVLGSAHEAHAIEWVLNHRFTSIVQ